MLLQASREAFCYYRNAVLHNERITWAGFATKVIHRQAFWTSPSKRSLTIVPPGQFRPPVISTVTGGLLIGLVLEAQPLGRTTVRTKMLFTNALASGDAGGHISPMYLASAISVMS